MSILKKQEYYHGFFLESELDKSHKHKMDQIFDWLKLYWNFDLYGLAGDLTLCKSPVYRLG